jgi:3-carboxy-cis,cis-muconate cycloisomerase
MTPIPRRYSSTSPGTDDQLGTLADTEAALARAAASLGRIPAAAAAAITEACDRRPFDPEEVRDTAEEHATLVVPLVERLRRALPAEYREFLHKPATSQDIIDTALMLQARRTLDHAVHGLDHCAGVLVRLHHQYADTPQLGRTLLQPALPTAFANLLGAWQAAVDDARLRLASVRDLRLAVQLGGPVGDLDDPELVAAFAAELNLAVPERPWHTVRTRVVDLAAALGLAVGVLGKLGADVALLAQAEIGELTEGSSGLSSSMPHKRNPARAVQLVALAQRAPGLVATVFAALPQELHRSAGRWQSEDAAVRELLTLTATAVRHATALLDGLQPHPDRMKANLR